MSGKREASIGEYSEAPDSLFRNRITEGVVIRFESDGYVLCLEIRNGRTEILVLQVNA